MKRLVESYKAYKKLAADALLCILCGDKYYLLEQDAIKASCFLGKISTKDGVQYLCFEKEKLDEILPIIIRRNYRVALCEIL